MKKKSAMALMRQRIEEERLITREPHSWSDGFREGIIQGLESALYFLDEPQAVRDLEARINGDTVKRAEAGECAI